MDIDEEISTKSSNLTQPSEIGNDQKFHKFIEFLERELKKRPEVVRNNFIHMNQAFLYENPVQEINDQSNTPPLPLYCSV
ncbi:hypothetical protein PVAND_012658 [Polypedilum vanderplanki]|uniref:Uncharacterized protein n=1 Tax=Polypedilum vanderplanki TaxID=319348 RepID=A0A9J6CN30_POLVA|nr:hypothetical protein PVAND_012658 [Polypedilum vanderplanki]